MWGLGSWIAVGAADFSLTAGACAAAELTRARREEARRAVLVALWRHCRAFGRARGLSGREVARRSGLGEERARRALRQLEDRGLACRVNWPARPYDFAPLTWALTPEGELAAMTARGQHAAPAA